MMTKHIGSPPLMKTHLSEAGPAQTAVCDTVQNENGWVFQVSQVSFTFCQGLAEGITQHPTLVGSVGSTMAAALLLLLVLL